MLICRVKTHAFEVSVHEPLDGVQVVYGFCDLNDLRFASISC